jgi:hypothetical protein
VLNNWAVKESAVVNLALRPVLGIKTNVLVRLAVYHLGILIIIGHLCLKQSVSIIISHVLLCGSSHGIMVLIYPHSVKHGILGSYYLTYLLISRVHIKNL